MQFDEILSRFQNVKRTGDRQYIACCPAHDDAKQSLSIGAGDGKILLNCFAGCDTRNIVAAVGLTMKDLYTDHSGSTYTSPATLPKKKPVSQRQGAKPAAYTHSKEYIYTDEDGAFIARKIKRYDDSGNKTFAWKTFDADGNEINGNGMKGSPMYLYNIAELCRNRDALAADGTPVYIVEGEKDADTVKDMSLVAVSLPNGASSAWNKDAYNKYFIGLNVVILTDNDDAGRKSGHKIANALLNTASSIKLIHSESIYTELKEKGDITDIVVEIGAEKAKTALLAAVDTAPVYKLKKPEAPQHDDLPMFILEKTDRLGNVTYTVSAPLLAEHIRRTLHYYFFKNQSKSAFIFVYNSDKGVYEKCVEDEFKAFIKEPVEKFGMIYATSKVIDEAYKLLKTDKSDKCRIEESKFNADANIINFRNGLLNVETLELMPHTPDALSTIQLPCDWNPNAPAPKCFIEFMNTLSGGDEGKKQLMLEYCGVAVSNIDASLPKKCLFLVGPGDTGKSKLLELLVMLLGKDNYTELKLQNLEKDVHATFDLWGKRLAGSPDMQYAKVAELAIFKTLSGGDNINFNRKYADSFSGKFKGILMFCTNQMPLFGGDKGDHVYGRMMILKCENVIPVEKRDALIVSKMVREAEGILPYFVTYLKKFIANGYHYDIPECCDIACEAYKVENDPVRRFLSECTQSRTQKQIFKSELTKARVYQCYKNWCLVCKEYTVSKSTFNMTLCQKYKVRDIAEIVVKTNGGNEYYKPFTLTQAAINEYGC